MKNNSELKFLMDKSKQDFEVLKKWTNLNVMSEDESEENLKKLIGYKIAKMLETDYDALLHLLYATDINENKVKLCFGAEKTNTEIGYELAELYLNRLKEKWTTRQIYSNKDIVGDWD